MSKLKLEYTLSGHTDRIWTLAWNPQGTVLASSGSDKSIRLWSFNGSTPICQAVLTESHLKTIRYIAWSPCGKYLASASFDSTICLWKQNNIEKTWSTIGNLEGHESEVKCIAWSHDGKFLASCGRDKSVWIWERAQDDDMTAENSDDDEDWDCSDVKNDHSKDVKHIVWHPTTNILVSTSYDDTLKIYHKTANDWSCYQTLTGHTSTVWSADFSKTGQYLASCSADKSIKIWVNQAHSGLPDIKSNSWRCCCTLQGYHTRVIYDISWCKLTDTIVSASGDNSLAIFTKNKYDEGDGASLYSYKLRAHQSHSSDINCVRWNPKRVNVLASAGDDLDIKIWSFIDTE